MTAPVSDYLQMQLVYDQFARDRFNRARSLKYNGLLKAIHNKHSTQQKKVPRERIVTAKYSIENALGVYKLSAQLYVINKENNFSIGDIEGRISTASSKNTTDL